jgi:hypothetical protein
MLLLGFFVFRKAPSSLKLTGELTSYINAAFTGIYVKT